LDLNLAENKADSFEECSRTTAESDKASVKGSCWLIVVGKGFLLSKICGASAVTDFLSELRTGWCGDRVVFSNLN
jgi:hypothetical protein